MINASRSSHIQNEPVKRPVAQPILGIICGNGPFPLLFARQAQAHHHQVLAVCHVNETNPEIELIAERCSWIKVGQLGKLINCFLEAGVKQVVLAGGINRVRLFGGVKLDLRGAALLAKLRSTKDDVIMRGIAAELEKEGISVLPCTTFMEEYLVPQGVITTYKPSTSEIDDVEVGISAIQAMSAQDIGQLVVVRDGVIVAVEAVEGTDAAIRRGGELGGKGTVVVKFAKTTQDLRFDLPTIGKKTIETMIEVEARVLAVEAGKSIILDREEVVRLANKCRISIIGTSQRAS